MAGASDNYAGSELTPDPLCQVVKDTTARRESRRCDKLVALQTFGKMCDWFSPTRLEVSSDSLASYLLELRAKSLFDEPAVSIERRPMLPLGNGENGSDRQGASE